MKDLNKLKEEQEELKERLTKLIAFINSEEYYNCSSKEQTLLTTQRAGMELYLDSLTKRIYDTSNGNPSFTNSSIWPIFMLSLYNSTPSFDSSKFDNFKSEDNKVNSDIID